MQVEPIVEQIWPGRATSVERLGGGITNHNFKVVAGGEAYVLRIGGNGAPRHRQDGGVPG